VDKIDDMSLTTRQVVTFVSYGTSGKSAMPIGE